MLASRELFIFFIRLRSVEEDVAKAGEVSVDVDGDDT